MSPLASCGRFALIVTLLTTLVPSRTYSQSTASISGVVKDADGAVLPGVTVTVKNDTTGQSQDVTTDGDGRYQVTALGAGSYTVSAALSGFKTATAKNISVAPGQPVAIPLTLEIGQLEETIIVTSSSELVNTQNGTVAATLNADQITRMPTPTSGGPAPEYISSSRARKGSEQTVITSHLRRVSRGGRTRSPGSSARSSAIPIRRRCAPGIRRPMTDRG